VITYLTAVQQATVSLTAGLLSPAAPSSPLLLTTTRDSDCDTTLRHFISDLTLI